MEIKYAIQYVSLEIGGEWQPKDVYLDNINVQKLYLKP